MSAKKNVPTGAATSAGTKMEAGTGQATTSTHHDTTSPSPGQRVSDYLLPGQQNAVPLKRLKELLDLDGRTIRLMIRSERLQGTPILESSAATGGYYLPGNDHERDRCVQRLRNRAAEIVRVADAIEGGGRD